MMNMASVVVLGIVAGLLVLSIISLRKKDTGGCDGNCAECGVNCTRK